MKATMGATGELSITPETPLESYALNVWFNQWNQHLVTLRIAIPDPKLLNAVSLVDIRAPEVAA